jgi:hypothetical protein
VSFSINEPTHHPPFTPHYSPLTIHHSQFSTFAINITGMNTIIIKPKTKEEQDFLTRLLKKMNIDANLVEEPMPNYETRKAMEEVQRKRGTKVKDSQELFTKLEI